MGKLKTITAHNRPDFSVCVNSGEEGAGKCPKCGRECGVVAGKHCRNQGGYECQIIESGNALRERPELMEKLSNLTARLAAVEAERDGLRIDKLNLLNGWEQEKGTVCRLRTATAKLRGLVEDAAGKLESVLSADDPEFANSCMALAGKLRLALEEK